MFRCCLFLVRPSFSLLPYFMDVLLHLSGSPLVVLASDLNESHGGAAAEGGVFQMLSVSK